MLVSIRVIHWIYMLDELKVKWFHASNFNQVHNHKHTPIAVLSAIKTLVVFLSSWKKI